MSNTENNYKGHLKEDALRNVNFVDGWLNVVREAKQKNQELLVFSVPMLKNGFGANRNLGLVRKINELIIKESEIK